MADVFGFNSRDAEDLIASIGGGDRTERLNFGTGGGGTATRDTIIVKTKVGGIPARSGTTIGAADCDVFEVVGTTLTDAGYDVEVINITLGAVAGSVYGVASRELNSDQWVLVVEECVGTV
jgi:hypothetical protein